MIIPVRCFSCGKVIGSSWEKFHKMTAEEGKSVASALDELKLTRMCCRAAVMSHVDMIDEVGAY